MAADYHPRVRNGTATLSHTPRVRNRELKIDTTPPLVLSESAYISTVTLIRPVRNENMPVVNRGPTPGTVTEAGVRRGNLWRIRGGRR